MQEQLPRAGVCTDKTGQRSHSWSFPRLANGQCAFSEACE